MRRVGLRTCKFSTARRSLTGMRSPIHYVSKNIPDIFSRNSRKHYRIFIMFGTCVTEKVSKQYIDIQFILDEENFNSRHGAQAA